MQQKKWKRLIVLLLPSEYQKLAEVARNDDRKVSQQARHIITAELKTKLNSNAMSLQGKDKDNQQEELMSNGD